MNGNKWTSAAVSAVTARSYPKLWTAVLFAAVPVLLRAGSSLLEGALLLCVGRSGFESAVLIAVVAFVAGVVGLVKHGSRQHVLAYVLWLATFLSVAVLGILMFEAFSPPQEWSGSLALPRLIVFSCCGGVLAGLAIRQVPWYRRRFGTDAAKY